MLDAVHGENVTLTVMFSFLIPSLITNDARVKQFGYGAL